MTYRPREGIEETVKDLVQLTELEDVDVASAQADDFLSYNGTQWVATPFEAQFAQSGFIDIASTGTFSVTGVGYQPQTIILFLTSRMNTENFAETPPTNQNNRENSLGNGTGIATRDSLGNITQSSQFVADSSSSVNSHRQESSNSNFITIVEIDNNGNVEGRADGSLTSFDSDGFTYNISTYTLFRNAIIQYIVFPSIRGAKGDKGDQGVAGSPGDVTWEGVWNSSTTYVANQAVEYNGSSFVCVQTNTNSLPATDNSNPDWELLALQGATGAGSSVEVQNDGISVNTSASIIDFDSGLEATNTSSTTVTITKTTNLFYGYSTVAQTVGTSWVDINIGVETRKDSDFVHAVGAAEVTVNKSGWFKITADLTMDATVGSNRTESEMRILRNGSEEPGTRGGLYHRLSGRGINTASVTTVVQVNSGDIFKIQAIKNGNDTIATVPNGVRLLIEEI